ncbi:MAG: membrane protein insertase YidC [Opitutae bacterium]|nr:membrane protein insertase YidC [Opitutae bacterium]
MDKKNTIIGVLLLAAAFGSLWVSSKFTPPSQPQPAPEITRTVGPNQATSSATAAARPTSPPDAAFAAVAKDTGDARIVTLANDVIAVNFTNQGGAIRDIALKKYDAEKKHPGVPYIVNQLHADPALAFVDYPGLDRRTRYELVSQTPTEVTFRTVVDGTLEVTRRYTLVPGNGDAKADPYQIRYDTTLRNLTDKELPRVRTQLSLGTAAPVDVNDYGVYLSTGYYDKTDHFVKRSDLEGGGFLSWIGMGSRDPLRYIENTAAITWASVQNQFFTSILTPDQSGAGLITRRVELPSFPGTMQPAIGVTGAAQFDLPVLAAKGEIKLGGGFYAGPKEYSRLSNAEIFKHNQDAVMEFGMFSFFSKILLTLMSWVHKSGASWGVAIIITTLILKIVFLPLTLSASKSAKRMQKIQPEMAAMKEKYKDNPQKMQQATMELFKKHKVNPMGGCFPILITIPFFIGFFSMLQSTAELRFQTFLWAQDLSAPDTIATISLGFMNLPINIMPILMGATMIIQMQLTPQPTVDNAQAKMFKFMPYIFALMCYSFSCALSLYSTINGIFTIGQQLVINRMKDADDAPAAEPIRGGRPVKNVTPAKKK